MSEPARCPQCAEPMHEVSARARSGYLIVLDQCARCGGIWCDRWELFPLAAEEAARLDPVDETQLHAAADTSDTPGRCPRCTAPLQPFRDPNLPPDARIERCRVCDGMWLNCGALSRAKQRTPPTRTPVQSATVDRLAETYASTTHWSKVANLDGATYQIDNDEAGPSEAGKAAWAAVPWIVLRTLIYLLMRV